MPVDFGDRAREIIARLKKASASPPCLQKPEAELAIKKHYSALGLPEPSVIWVDDAEAGWHETYKIAWSAAESAAWSAAPEIERWIGIWLPFLEAYEAGLWLFFSTEKGVIAVPRPVMHLEGERLHNSDGPAVWWPNGKGYYFWRGVQVPERIILQPDTIKGTEIVAEQNAEVRRVMIERYGWDRLLTTSGTLLQRDDRGELWRLNLAGDEAVTGVKVTNSTAETDGSFKPYFLRVHPELRPLLGNDRDGRPRLGEIQDLTARNAVASTFGLRGDQYQPGVQT